MYHPEEAAPGAVDIEVTCGLVPGAQAVARRHKTRKRRVNLLKLVGG